jgi:hypothetical protein
MCNTEGKQFQRVLTKKQICYTFLSSFFVHIAPTIDAEKYIGNTFVHTFIYTEDKSSLPGRKKNMEQQHSTTKLRLYAFPQISFSHT